MMRTILCKNTSRQNTRTEWHRVSVSVITEDMNTHELHRVRGVSNWGFNEGSRVLFDAIRSILRNWGNGDYKSIKADRQTQDIILNSIDGFRYNYNLETMHTIIKALDRIDWTE